MSSAESESKRALDASIQRVNANCKVLWKDCNYDFDVETDDYVHYIYFVKKDFGDSIGPPLMMSTLCNSEKQAWADLDQTLSSMAMHKKNGTKMTKEQQLQVFGGPRGEHRRLLSEFIDEFERRENNGTLYSNS